MKLSVAFILAGGLGKRLRPLTEELPKPLLPLDDNRRILDFQLEWLKRYGISEVFLLVGYLKEKIIEYAGSGSKWGVHISYIVEDEPLGTGGAIRNAAQILSKLEPVLVVNGDVVTNINLTLLIDALASGASASIAVVPLRSPYGIVEVGLDGRVLSFKEKPVLTECWINAGVYAFTRRVIEYLPKRGGLEEFTFPELAKKGELVAVKFDVPPYYWRSIDSFKDLEEVSEDVKKLKLL